MGREVGRKFPARGHIQTKISDAKEKIYLWFSALRINGPSLELGQNLHPDQRNLVLVPETVGSNGRWLFWWWLFFCF